MVCICITVSSDYGQIFHSVYVLLSQKKIHLLCLQFYSNSPSKGNLGLDHHLQQRKVAAFQTPKLFFLKSICKQITDGPFTKPNKRKEARPNSKNRETEGRKRLGMKKIKPQKKTNHPSGSQ